MRYRIKGRRFLKKYTAAFATPAYAVIADAQAVVDGLCDTPWQEVEDEVAQMAYHTSEVVDNSTGTTGLDMNVAIRNRLDAALWCADHSGGRHRAYANAACYVFEMPEMAAYPNLTAVKLRVTSDPYNSTGVRLAVHLSDTLDIPVNCAEAREGIAHIEGVAKREERKSSDNKIYWYAATEKVTISVSSQSLKKYLFLVVGLENYNVSRGDWLEGCAYISPVVEIETDGEVTGWNENHVASTAKGTEFVVRKSGDGWESTDDWAWKKGFYNNANEETLCALTGDAYIPGWTVKRTEGENPTTELKPFREDDILVDSGTFLMGQGKTCGGIQECYAAFYADKMHHPISSVGENWCTVLMFTGAGFAVGRGVNETGDHYFFIARKKGLVTFSLPKGFKAKKMRITNESKCENRAEENNAKIKRNVWLARNSRLDKYLNPTLQKHELYTASIPKVGEWELLASINDTVNAMGDVFEFDVDISNYGPHTLLLTCFIDQTEIDLTSQEIQCKGHGMYSSISRSAESFLWCGGAFSGGWGPTITLLG